MSWRSRVNGPPKELGDRPSLEAVLDHYAVDHKHSTRQMVRCPQHEDSTPSCSVDLDQGLWKCHSCDTGGDAWELIKRMEGTDFDGAKQFAAAQRLTAGDERPGRDRVSGGSWRGRGDGAVPRQSGDHGGGGGYVPSWRRGNA